MKFEHLEMIQIIVTLYAFIFFNSIIPPIPNTPNLPNLPNNNINMNITRSDVLETVFYYGIGAASAQSVIEISKIQKNMSTERAFMYLEQF